jgi:hypothetical protein
MTTALKKVLIMFFKYHILFGMLYVDIRSVPSYLLNTFKLSY